MSAEFNDEWYPFCKCFIQNGESTGKVVISRVKFVN